MTDYTEKQVAVNDVSLWTIRHGNGSPVVFCHGGPGLYDYLTPVADMVDDMVTVFRYDQRGGGRSQKKGPYNVATFVADLDLLRRHWRIDKWGVFGHSWGAVLALHYTLRHPSNVSGLIYMSGTGIDSDWRGWREEYHRNEESKLSETARQRLHDLREKAQSLSDSEHDDIRREINKLLRPANLYDLSRADELLREEEYPPNYELNHIVNSDWRRILESEDLASQVSEINVPALVIHPEGDPRPRKHAENVARLLPQGQFVSLPKAGHEPWLEQPESTRNILRDFLENLC